MTTIEVNTYAAETIERLRKSEQGEYKDKLEKILVAISGLNDVEAIIYDGRELTKKNDYAKTVCIEYFTLLRSLAYKT